MKKVSNNYAGYHVADDSSHEETGYFPDPIANRVNQVEQEAYFQGAASPDLDSPHFRFC